MGGTFNTKIGLFYFNSGGFFNKGFNAADPKSEKQFMNSLQLGRIGHIAFWHFASNSLVMFGGENNGASSSSKLRTTLNDILLFDIHNFTIND